MNSFKQLLNTCLILSISGWTAHAIAASPQKAGFVLLREGLGSRAEAMGGAYTAVVGDQTAAFWNPAGIAALKGKDFLLTHHSSFEGILQSYGGWAYGNTRRGIALSLGIHSAGDIEARTGPSAKPLGTFGLYEINAGLTYAQRIGERVYAGVTIRALHETIGPERASGAAIDLGLLYRLTGKSITLGAAYRNLGRMQALDRERIPLPGTFRAGIAWNGGRLTTSLDLRFPRHSRAGIHTGAEYRIKQTLFLRTGYRTGHDIRDWSFGLGLERGGWRIEYAFVPAALGLVGSHRLGLGIR